MNAWRRAGLTLGLAAAVWIGIAPAGARPPVLPALEPAHRGIMLASARPDVFRAENMLSNLGFKPGPVDGIYSGATKAAIERFQRAKGLAVDGLVTGGLLAHLQRALAVSFQQVVHSVRTGEAEVTEASESPEGPNEHPQ